MFQKRKPNFESNTGGSAHFGQFCVEQNFVRIFFWPGSLPNLAMQLGLVEYIDGYIIQFFDPAHTERATGLKSPNYAKNMTFSTVSSTPLCNWANFMPDNESPSIYLSGDVWQPRMCPENVSQILRQTQLGQPILVNFASSEIWPILRLIMKTHTFPFPAMYNNLGCVPKT